MSLSGMMLKWDMLRYLHVSDYGMAWCMIWSAESPNQFISNVPVFLVSANVRSKILTIIFPFCLYQTHLCRDWIFLYISRLQNQQAELYMALCFPSVCMIGHCPLRNFSSSILPSYLVVICRGGIEGPCTVGGWSGDTSAIIKNQSKIIMLRFETHVKDLRVFFYYKTTTNYLLVVGTGLRQRGTGTRGGQD